jgi:hypothetical protein
LFAFILSLYGLSSSVNFRFVFNALSALSTFSSNRQAGFRFFLRRPTYCGPSIRVTLGHVKMFSKIAVVAGLLAIAEARFGQEGAVQSVISALGNFGQPGQAATLAGQTPGVLLAGANACAKVDRSKRRAR